MNLLPEFEQRALRRRYLLRLGVVAVALLGAVLAFVAFLLLPSVILSSVQRTSLSAQHEALSAELAAGGSEETTRYLAETDRRVALAREIFDQRSVRQTLDLVVSVVPDGVRVNSISLTQSIGRPALSIKGTAVGRTQLLTFTQALDALPFVQDYSFPFDDLGRNTDIPFDLTIQLTDL